MPVLLVVVEYANLKKQEGRVYAMTILEESLLLNAKKCFAKIVDEALDNKKDDEAISEIRIINDWARVR